MTETRGNNLDDNRALYASLLRQPVNFTGHSVNSGADRHRRPDPGCQLPAAQARRPRALGTTRETRSFEPGREFASLRRDRFDRSRGRHIKSDHCARRNVFFWDRVVMAIGHIGGTPRLRSVAYFVSISGLIMILLQIF